MRECGGLAYRKGGLIVRSNGALAVRVVAWIMVLVALAAGLWAGGGIMPDKPAYFLAEMRQGRVVLVEGTRWQTDDCHKITKRFPVGILSEPADVVEAVTPDGVHRGWARLEPQDCTT